MTTRLLVLAAGEGRRMRPLTSDRPKCLIKIAGKSILQWQIETARRLGIDHISVVTGYKSKSFEFEHISWYHNPDYAETNMVETLWCAKEELEDSVIVSYGDILYEDSILHAAINAPTPISVVVDLDWRSYWEQRFADPISDAESLRLDRSGRILELGQNPESLDDIQGQYIGLMKFQGAGIADLKNVHDDLVSGRLTSRSGKPVKNIYMTDLLQAIIDAGLPVQSVPIHRCWLEIDSVPDYELACTHTQPDHTGLRITI